MIRARHEPANIVRTQKSHLKAELISHAAQNGDGTRDSGSSGS